MRNKVTEYIKKKYKAAPEYLWKKYPDYAVFRHKDNRKWFAIIMDVTADKIGLPGEGRIDIIDVKVADAMFKDVLLQQPGFYPGYHMNKGNWITAVLDGTVPEDQVFNMIDASFEATGDKRKKKC